MRFSQILSESEKEIYEAQTAALLKPNQKANFGAAPAGYSGTTTTIKPTKLPAAPQPKVVPSATPVQGAYSVKGATAPGQPSTAQSQAPAAPGVIPSKAAPEAPAEIPGKTASAEPQQPDAQETQPSAPDAGSKVGGFIRGAGNLASQVAGGVTQTLGAAGGGLARGFQSAKAGQNFSATAPNNPSQYNPSSRVAGDTELADLRARLDSIETLLKSKP